MSTKYEPVNREEEERLTKAYPTLAEAYGFCRGNPDNVLLTGGFLQLGPSFSRLQLRKDDVFISTLPKSGTQWMMEIVWLIANDCDFEGAKTLLRHRVPMLEERAQFAQKHWINNGSDVSNPVDSMTSPRFIKTHLPFSHLPSDLLDVAKVVYVARNPKDVAVSSYFHHKLTYLFDTTLNMEDYFEFLMNGDVFYTPIWPHLLQAWKLRHHPNLLLIFYEDLKSDLPKQLNRVAAFMGKQELSRHQVELLTKHLCFDRFRANPAVNKQELNEQGHYKKGLSFIRKGQVGDWRNYFSQEMSARFDDWIAQNTAGTDLQFRYDSA